MQYEGFAAWRHPCKGPNRHRLGPCSSDEIPAADRAHADKLIAYGLCVDVWKSGKLRLEITLQSHSRKRLSKRRGRQYALSMKHRHECFNIVPISCVGNGLSQFYCGAGIDLVGCLFPCLHDDFS